MKLGGHRGSGALVALALSAAACQFVWDYDGFREQPAASSSGSGAGGASDGALARPPARGPMETPDGGSAVTFAITHVYFGDRDLDGGVDPNAWQQFGYNIDGVSPSDTSAFCKPALGADPSQVHQEGPSGVENAFGHFIVRLIVSLNMQATAAYNQELAAGDFTYLITLDNLGSGLGENPLQGHFALGGNRGSPPKLDGTDTWPIVQGTSIDFPDGYVVGDTWVSGAPTDVTLSLIFLGATFQLPLELAVLTMQLDPAHRTATGGILAGVVPTAQLEPQILALAGAYMPSLCTDPLIMNVLESVEQASDILQDGTQDPTKTCDAITVGLGFTAVAAQVGSTVEPTAPTNACGDAGTD